MLLEQITQEILTLPNGTPNTHVRLAQDSKSMIHAIENILTTKIRDDLYQEQLFIARAASRMVTDQIEQLLEQYKRAIITREQENTFYP